ncbi:MAG: GAF domain-containing protein [Anaerolineaceae bacterium]|nr:GAF domain-containing protein [Anaerolineaceae bacterium]
MQIIFSLLSASPYIELPIGWLGWVGFILLFMLFGAAVWRFWETPDMRAFWRWVVFLVLLFATPFTSLFFGLRITPEAALPVPGLPVEMSGETIMFFLAIPWALAAGLLGVVPAVTLAFFSGLLIGFWDTHSIFTLLRIASLALLFSTAIRQRYRTLVFRFLRRPLGSAFVLALAFIPLHMLITFLEINGSLAVRVDYALSLTGQTVAARSAELLIAGAVCELVSLLWPGRWGLNTPLLPSPSEKNLEVRFFYRTAPLMLALVFVLMISDWAAAGSAARRMIQDRLASTALVAAESLPYFLETGQNLILTVADPDLAELSPEMANKELARQLQSVPYFRVLFLLDEEGRPVTGYPISDFTQLQTTPEETTGIQLALKGVPVQTYTLPAWPGETTAQISYIGAIFDRTGEVKGVVLGRTDLNSNPFTQPAIEALKAVADSGGEGAILDENRRILYHSVSSRVLTDYLGALPSGAGLIEDVSSLGVRQLVYHQPVLGRPWSVVLSVPVEQAQQLALDIAVPLLVLLLAISAIIFLLLRISLRKVTSSLETLAQEATLISQGRLDHSLFSAGEDEVARFSRAFEKMRLSLKARLDELNRFLHVSQGVASHLQVEEAMKPILQAAMIEDACMARIVLVREVLLDTQVEPFATLGFGPSADSFMHLDHQLFELTQQHAILSIPNLSRSRRLTIEPALVNPAALIALPVHQDNVYYGVLWVAFEEPRNFTEEEVQFLETLADQAAIAATNAKLYATSEIGRQRLEAVLASTPEPVLVIDEYSRLYLLNPAALQTLGLITTASPGRAIKEVISSPELLDLIVTSTEDRLSTREITLSGNKIYFASVSPVVAENRPVGKICLLRDITHYKELETLKSDFVSTVSHDLRSPLTLMRGYATMMQMVGDLNDQQKIYVQKVVTGVENMSRLVTNLLDLGRIEAGIGLQIERVSAKTIMNDVAESLQPQAVQKNIQVSQEVVNEIPGIPDVFIEADQALIQQALYNLVDNAIKYTKVGGQVKIRLTSQGQRILYEVKDSGIGVAPLDLPHMFERFYRSGRREAYAERGTGLGLAIVKSIAERHGGRVWVESQLGKGSTFSMEIPAKHSSRTPGRNE